MPYTPEIIEKLKAVKEERGYSLQDIADMTEEAGCAVSLTTIKRVFSNNYKEQQTFRYSKTIKPIADVLLGADEPDSDLARSDMFDLLNRQIVTLEEALRKRDLEYTERVEFLKSRIKRSDRIIHVLSLTLGVLLAAIIVVLIMDRLSPNIGWFRY